MIVTGERTIDATMSQTLAALADPQAIADESGAVSDFNEVDNAVRVCLAPKLNLGTHDLTLEITTIRHADNKIDLSARGQSGEHRIGLNAEMQVSEAGGQTLISWQADVTVLGVLAAVGQRALPWVVRDQVEVALDAVEAVASARS